MSDLHKPAEPRQGVNVFLGTKNKLTVPYKTPKTFKYPQSFGKKTLV